MAGQSPDMSGEEGYVYGHHGKCHLSGRRLLFGAWSSSCNPSPASSTPKAATPAAPAGRMPPTRPPARGDTGFGGLCGWNTTPSKVSLDALLLAYFYVIDPVQNRRGQRPGPVSDGVYRTGVGPSGAAPTTRNYYPAEEYHQNDLEKNPQQLLPTPRAEMELFSRLRIDPGDYRKPAAETIRDKLTAEQYRVTQESGTERAFTGELWDKFEKGIYVDIVTGEPLFSSTDKFESGCGWPLPHQSPSKALPWWNRRT